MRQEPWTKVPMEFRVSEEAVFNFAYFVNGDQYLLGCYGEKNAIALWNVKTGERFSNPKIDLCNIDNIRMVCEGRRLTISDNGDIHILRLSDNKEMCTIKAAINSFVGFASFSSDGSAIVASEQDNVLGLWKKRFPEPWWGLFYRTEFWSSFCFAGILGKILLSRSFKKPLGSKTQPVVSKNSFDA